MSEHKKNPMAMVADAGGRRLSAGLVVGFAPKHNILVLPPDRVRTTEDGRTEVRATFVQGEPIGSGHAVTMGDGDAWTSAPEGIEPVADGTTLDMSKLDFVVALAAQAHAGMVDPSGRVVTRQRHLKELHREDAQHFVATLGGTGPVQRAS